MVGIAGGADVIVIPEVESDPDTVAAALRDAYTRGKRHAMVVVAEGAKWNATALANYVTKPRDRIGFELRATILGHVQRGGGPGAFDRLLASRTAAQAVDLLAAGESGVYTALVKGVISALPLERGARAQAATGPGAGQARAAAGALALLPDPLRTSCSRRSMGRPPFRSTSSWNARMSNRGPSAAAAESRKLANLSWPILVGERLTGPRDVAVHLDGNVLLRLGGVVLEELQRLLARPPQRVDSGIEHETHRAPTSHR